MLLTQSLPTSEPARSSLPLCPYTGLRTFSEAEAIYFRGREAHVGRCVELLAEQHFIMITGASGDGKSSLVYAGLLPEIRAGFFRAKYSNWAVCTFRPERQPLRQMARAVANGLRLGNSTGAVEAVEDELRHGFSALVQLYQQSSLVPAPPADTNQSVPTETAHHQLEAANLLVIVDQFEEFFTNAENYAGDSPAAPAQTVVNLLLETARLARELDLPIHIICTMRSDYIGQCADFQGLVELIGKSQYFVPRLLRAEMVRIIREPAMLSGSHIAERLVQRLADDNRDGRDQLPELQHALYRIWVAARHGRETMDLLHYAMVGGLPFSEVPLGEDQAKLTAWRQTLTWQDLSLLHNPSLSNVLNAHADQLYASVTDAYNRDFGPPLSRESAARVVELTFRSLTKVDAHRVVRNRLTGAELTAIINDPNLPWHVVCQVLRPFRLPGNTFLLPFITAADDVAILPSDTVLDITHESLIRNWQKLAAWALAEDADVATARQLTTQATAWAAAGFAKSFLLPLGPYLRFEKWRTHKQLNTGWLAYYVADSSTPAPERLGKGEEQMQLLNSYLESSRRRLWLSLFGTHLAHKYGIGWVITGLAALLLLVGVAGSGWLLREKRSNFTAYTILHDRLHYLNSPYVTLDNRARLVVEAERLKDFAQSSWFDSERATEYKFDNILNSLHNDTLALDLELQMFAQVSNVERDSVATENPLLRPLLFDMGQRLLATDSIGQPGNGAAPSQHQRDLAVRTGRYVMALAYYLAWTTPNPALPDRPQSLCHTDSTQKILANLKTSYLGTLRRYLRQEVAATTGPPPSSAKFSYCLQVVLAQGNFTEPQLDFLKKINPFSLATKPAFERLFSAHRPVSKASPLSMRQGTSGYLAYAIIAAALHQPTSLIEQCLAAVNKSHPQDPHYGSQALPYFIKYQALSPGNAFSLLSHCTAATSSTSGMGFAKAFSQTAYGLLAVLPTKKILAYNQRPTVDDEEANLDTDLVSFSAGAAQREEGFRALRGAISAASQEQIFAVEDENSEVSAGAHESFIDALLNTIDRAKGSKVPVGDKAAFLDAFLSKMQGIYESETTASKTDTNTWFRHYDDITTTYRQNKTVRRLNPLYWGDATFEEVARGIPFPTVESFLAQISPPKTAASKGYYTCFFNSFFAHQLASPNTSLADIKHLQACTEAIIKNDIGNFSITPGQEAAALRVLNTETYRVLWRKLLSRLPAADSIVRRRDTDLLIVLADTHDRTALMVLNPLTKIAAAKRFRETPEPLRTSLLMALANLAQGMGTHGRYRQGFALANLLGKRFAPPTQIRVAEQAMFGDDDTQNDDIFDFLQQYQKTTLAAANGNIVSLYYWQSYKQDSKEPLDFQAQARLTVQEGGIPSIKENGINFMCRGRTLAGDSYLALQQIPEFESENNRQTAFNIILTNLAHLDRAYSPNDGWEEYDNDRLLSPNDYSRSIHLAP